MLIFVKHRGTDKVTNVPHSIIFQGQVHLQRNILCSQQLQCCFFPPLHYFQPKILDAPFFCIVLRQPFSFRNKILKVFTRTWNHGNIEAQECCCSLMYYPSMQNNCMPETTLRLQLLLIQKEAALLKRQEIFPHYTGELWTVTKTRFWNHATFFN